MLMAAIDPTARIETGAQIGRDVSIGPYCVVGPHVTIGEGCRLVAHVHITGHTTIGPRTTIQPFASLGTAPQSASYRGGPTRLEVGADCDIREHVTMNTGTESGGGITRVGTHCMFMVGSHVGHDCIVGSRVTLANGVLLGGHVLVGDHTFLGGGSGVHQFTRIGEGVMISGIGGVAADVIPFGLVIGHRGTLGGLNVVGLKRRGYKRTDMHRLRTAYRELFFGENTMQQRREDFIARYADDPLVGTIVTFLRNSGSRPLMRPTRAGGGASDADELE
jgi:UDP-N-acetylglucosamine acyltransferase